MPNFLIIGAGKAGTTSCYHYLRQHPQIFMSAVKEPNFFAFAGQKLDFRGPGDSRTNQRSVTNLAIYQGLFSEAGARQAIGEASNSSLYYPPAAQRIHHYIPQARLVALVRQPADRAFSNFVHLLRDGREPYTDFAQALADEENRIQKDWAFYWHYRQRGYYYRQLRVFFELFPKEQMRVYLYEEWNSHNQAVLSDLLKFLEVDDTFLPPDRNRLNEGKLFHSSFWRHFLTRPNRFKAWLKPILPEKARRALMGRLASWFTWRPVLDPHIRADLTRGYREDILQLQDLIGRDLSHWLES